jgi:hypothetical protein
MKLTITGIWRYTTKQDGSPLVGSNGKPYTSIRIKTQEYGDKLLSGFGDVWNAEWKDGQQIDVDVEEKGQYLNFKKVNPVKKLEERVVKLEAAVFKTAPAPAPVKAPVKTPEIPIINVEDDRPPINEADLPF